MRYNTGGGQRFYKQSDFWPLSIGGIFLFIFIVAFYSEILLALRLMFDYFRLNLDHPVNPLPSDAPKALILLIVNMIVYLGCYFLVLKWVSLFLLPARDSHERPKIFVRFTEYIFRLH